MDKPELLLPAGDKECLRAAVSNGADAVYLGLGHFNARRKAGNFTEKNLASVVKFCHDHSVKVYVTFNILIKNQELEMAMETINAIAGSGADAIIIQDPCFVGIIKKHFPGLSIHLSTQSTVTNSQSVPEGVERVILARELSYDQVRAISKKHETEVFVHGALCVCYSGQCLFSSVVGGRSGNRGLCAQPCRQKYNNKYLLSTQDLCLLGKLPEIASAGVKSLKIEGRLRSPLYVATAAKIYRKYIDMLGDWKGVEKSDVDLLETVFSRGFTEGYMFEDSIVDSKMAMNRGLFLGKVVKGKVKLRANLKKGEGIAVRTKEESKGHTVGSLLVHGQEVCEGHAGEVVDLGGLPEGTFVYKTSMGITPDLGDDLELKEKDITLRKISLPFKDQRFKDQKIIVRAYNMESAIEAEKAGCDIIYYDYLKNDFPVVKKKLKNAKLFADTPDIVFDKDIPKIVDRIKELKPDGIVIGNRGLLEILKGYETHLNQSFNVFNDIDMSCYDAVPLISPELSITDLKEMHDKRSISLIHGRLKVMTLKEKMKAPELVDDEGRHFEVVRKEGVNEIFNFKELGLLNKVKELHKIGVRYFLIDTKKDLGKWVRVYKKILSGAEFDDSKIKKGFTTGHFLKTVA